MGRERLENLTRIKVIQLGLFALALAPVGFGIFRLLGLDPTSSGIAAQALLVVVVLGWTGSYLVRVFTGRMTFQEQRKRYMEVYEEVNANELQSQFNKLSEAEKTRLIKEMNIDKEYFIRLI